MVENKKIQKVLETERVICKLPNEIEPNFRSRLK